MLNIEDTTELYRMMAYLLTRNNPNTMTKDNEEN